MTVASLIRALLVNSGTNDRADSAGRWFPLKAALALLALYAVMHLLVGGIIHLWVPDLAAAYIQTG